MKHFYKILFLLLTTWSINAQTTVNFAYTGAAQTWTVPAGVTSVTVVAKGASGLGSGLGLGGTVSATLAVISGQVLNIYVGGQNGYNGGGNPSGSNANKGGGATDIRTGAALTTRILVAGAGGSSGQSSQNAGNGGDLTGGSGYNSGSNGGTQMAGGSSGGFGSTDGVLGVGGNGGSTPNGAGGGGGGG